ncbi:short-chain dehydrogenase [Massilia sp. Root418]|uniref:oxidoreductase n=1 Tax=Massilia sp. Root418 TaxID=1736532 RepID=UPI000700009B|nr:oxidoreductase [Massilia sp. Root418]KQW88064.1 short-chain dehydrogenase [Massilia sp. Root418]
MNSKIAIVTGASSGIGAATAAQLAKAGYKVYGTSRRGGQGQAGGVEMLSLDVTSDESVAAAVNQVLLREGRIDLLVNNAGFGVAPAAAEESSIQLAQSIFDTNFFGMVRMVRAVVPHMRQRGGGRIINISSVLGFVPMPYMALYSASKHAMEGYSEALDQELRTQGIRVSLVAPAYIKSPFDANQLQPDLAMDEYSALRAGLDRRVKEALEGADGPGVVADTVLRVALAASPKVRYTSGALAGRLRFLRRYAPAALVEAGVRKDLRLDSQPPLRPRSGAAYVPVE